MEPIKINKGNVKMVAHRGLSGIETENTAAAFIAAGNRSYFGAETDIRFTRDGVIVLMHDGNTERVSGEKKLPEKTSFKRLSKLVFKDKIDGEKRGDLCIATLEDYLRICKKYNKHCVIEIKTELSPVQASKVAETVEKVYDLEHVTFISFVKNSLITMRALLPKQPMQFLLGEFKSEEHMAILDEYNFGLDVNHKCVTKEMIDEVHARGHEFNVWTVDDPARAEELANLGVDYITSNILE